MIDSINLATLCAEDCFTIKAIDKNGKTVNASKIPIGGFDPVALMTIVSMVAAIMPQIMDIVQRVMALVPQFTAIFAAIVALFKTPQPTPGPSPDNPPSPPNPRPKPDPDPVPGPFGAEAP